MRSAPPTLFVSIISGVDAATTSLVAAILSGHRPDHVATDELNSPTDDSGEFALDLAIKIDALADSGQCGHIVVQLDPRADTMEVGLIVDTMFQQRTGEQPAVRLRDLVTVADVRDIRRWLFADGCNANGRDCDIDTEDFDSGATLARQIEFATVVVLTHGDAVPDAKLREAIAVIAKLNPHALVLPLERAVEVVSKPRKRIEPRQLGGAMGWLLELSGKEVRPTTRASISSVVFRDPRPFHPGRLSEVIATCLEPETVGTIVRSRGLIRLASRPDRVGSWSSAGRILNIEPTAMLSWDPESPTGQELVFFGKDLDADQLTAVLGVCLLSDEELIAGPMEWAKYADPFPEWVVNHEH
ncbi:putative metal chaperone, involved in Zn homeostasis, GTPase of COG0523 family [Leifsonia rubra CMS 76R]|nr:putative metal chaperone, involved in Zn homeostasis, GTPase of COG0523 family [Leifsonia rubra CMS 76R]